MGHVRLSVVIPVYNDPEGIKQTLSSLVDQTYADERYEILVVDNNSTDRTPTVISSFSRNNPQLVTHLHETEIQSSYAARNRGIHRADGDYIAFVDADMHVDSDWTASVVRKMETNEWLYMACNVTVYTPKETSVGRYSRVTDFRVKHNLERNNFAPTCCLVTDAELFDAVGQFDSRFVSSGDVEFGQRVHEAGISQHFAPDIPMYHPARTTVQAYLVRQWRIGRGICQRRTLYPDRAENDPPLWKLLAPPRRKNFLETFDGAWQNRREAIAWYGYEYLGSVARGGGRLYERHFGST